MTNRVALLTRCPQLAGVLPADPPPRDAYIVRRDAEARDGAGMDLGGAARGGFLVLGVPNPALLARMLALTGPHGYRPPVDLVEPDPAVLATWLERVEPALVADARLTVFAGPNADEDYAAFRAAHLSRRDPSHVIRCARPAWTPPRGDGGPGPRGAAAAATRRRELLAAQDTFYADRTPESWAARFRSARDGGPPLRVLGLTTRYSTVVRRSMRDLAEAFRRQGCAFDLVMEPDCSSNDVDAWSALAARPYDLLVIINALRGQLADRVHAGIPCAAWIQDHVAPLAARAAGRSVGPLDRVLCPGPWTLASRFEYTYERLLAIGSVTGGDPFADEPTSDEELAPFRCDVSYASHASAPVEQLVTDLAAPKGAGFRAYLERIVAGLRAHGGAGRAGIPFDVRLAIALDAESASPAVRLTPAERAAAIVPLVDCLADRIFRHETLEWTARWARARGRDFRLYGEGWASHPTLAPFARGVIENGRPLACLARASAVNLQVNAYGSHHPRLLDALAAGGFVVSRANAADAVRAPLLALRDAVERRGIDDFAGLLARARHDEELRDLLARLRVLGLFTVAPASDPARRREERLLREVYDFPAELLTDEARFEAIRTAAPAPPRVAGDIEGFDALTFDRPEALHALLDRFVDDPAARAARAAPMRRAVLAHDSADVLVGRVVDAFCAVR